LTDRPAGNPHPEDSQRQINDLRELVAVDETFVPSRIEIGNNFSATDSWTDIPADFNFSTRS
jgi:hypothetical protein